MNDTSLLAGAAVRRLRRRAGLTQSAMAGRLGISPSYLNLIERNQRPLSGRMVVQLAETFAFDPRSLRQSDGVGGVEGLQRRLADARFADLAIDGDEIADWLAAAPHGALAFARLFDGGMTAPDTAITDVQDEPVDLVRREIERWENHFPALDHAAEALADELALAGTDPGAALAARLHARHHLTVRVLPAGEMPGLLRRLDLSARELHLSEMLGPAARQFQLAEQLALLEQRDALAAIANDAQFEHRAAWRLLRRHLIGYFAAALLMPYARFLRACEATGYDLIVLQRRFGVSFEQLAHRLTTLQRVGQRGLPFFMARIDRAGQFSKRFVGASGTPLLEHGGACPKWSATAAFDAADTIVCQQVAVPGNREADSRWFTMAQTVSASHTASGQAARFVVVLGIEAEFAEGIAQARSLALRETAATPIGPGCRHCMRADCIQRSLPPEGALLEFDERTRAAVPFTFGG